MVLQAGGAATPGCRLDSRAFARVQVWAERVHGHQGSGQGPLGMRDAGCGMRDAGRLQNPLGEAQLKPCTFSRISWRWGAVSLFPCFRTSGESCGFLRRAQALPYGFLTLANHGEASPSETEPPKAWTQALSRSQAGPLTAHSPFDWFPVFTFSSLRPEPPSKMTP